MRSNRTISLLMSFLILGASFVTLCHASETKSPEVHLIAQMCENHDCNRDSENQSCDEENCEHQICSDQSITSDFLPSYENQFAISTPILLEIIDFYLSPKLHNNTLLYLLDPPVVSVHRTTILRI